MHSVDGINWIYVEEGKEYLANRDQNTIVLNQFKEPFIARTVRICPTQWHDFIALRFEVYFIE